MISYKFRYLLIIKLSKLFNSIYNYNLKGVVWLKKSNWLLYFAYGAILFSYFAISSWAYTLLKTHVERTFDYLPAMVISLLIFIVLGLLLGLERFVLETKREGNWRINLPKAIFLGIPSLYFSFGTFIYCFCPIISSYPIQYFMVSRIDCMPFFQIILGYTICTSFIKVKV